MVVKEEGRNSFYVIRTMVGQEYNVALLIEMRAKSKGYPIKSIMVIDDLRGFVILETERPYFIDKLISGIRYVKGKVSGRLTFQDLERFISPKPVIEEIEVNDIVEIVGGPFRGMRGRVTHVDKHRGEITVELFETAFPLPITINADYVKKAPKEAEERSA